MKIDRPNVDVQPFASQSKTEERTVFGSKEITDKLEKNLNADFARGWGITPVSELPTMQDFNAVEFTVSSLVTHLYQNGIAEYAEKQTYNKGAVCLFEGDIYKSITDNNAGNILTDKTQWQSLKDAILDAIVVQQLGSDTDKVTSQKLVTDALNTKQPKGDYATKTDLTQGLNTKLNSSAVKQATGNSTTEVISQKACDENYAKKSSGEPLKVGRLNVESPTGDTIFNLGGTNGYSGAEFAYVKSSKRTQVHDKATKTTVSFPQKSGEIALKSDVEAIDNYPVGAPIPWPQASPPEGYLICNGEAFDKIKCPKLALLYPSGNLPDLRGYFIRGWDAGRGVDPGRVLFSYQEDAIRNITGRIGYARQGWNGPPVAADGAFSLDSNYNTKVAGGENDNWGSIASFDASRAVPTANENRPRNISFNYIVRAA